MLKHGTNCRCDDCTDALPRRNKEGKLMSPFCKEFNGGVWLVYYIIGINEFSITLKTWRQYPYVLP